MVKGKLHVDPRRDRPHLAPQSRGVTKSKPHHEKHANQDDEGGVVAIRKQKFYTVLIGPNPAIYTSQAAYKQAQRAHPEAKSFVSSRERKVRDLIAQYQKSLKPAVRPINAKAPEAISHIGPIAPMIVFMPDGFHASVFAGC